MAASFLFYDLETSGFHPREARIMQFAAQRTDMNLQPIGEPYNYLIKITDDVLPDPDAVLLTGITPQATIAEGLTEAEFLKVFTDEIATPDTIFVGFNSVRFDDEFMRFLHYRNYYDAYEWQWQDGRSRWDILDVVRMTRALRPDGIKWPYDSSGKPACKLTLMTAINGLDHTQAHDALNDVEATIALSRLLRDKQPKLFEYLLHARDKKAVETLVTAGAPFVYTSGKYASEHEKTTVVSTLAEHPTNQAVLVYDLRHDPTPFIGMSPADLAEAWKYHKDETVRRLPVKTLKYNRCPAVAPLSVLDAASQQRVHLPVSVIKANLQKLQVADGFIDNVLAALKLLDKHQQESLLQDETDVDARLYEGFFGNNDKKQMSKIRTATPQALQDLSANFQDDRLKSLLPLYKARNYPKSLSDEERDAWELFRQRKLLGGKTNSRAAHYFERLAQLSAQTNLTANQRYLLEELQLYGQSILPLQD